MSSSFKMIASWTARWDTFSSSPLQSSINALFSSFSLSNHDCRAYKFSINHLRRWVLASVHHITSPFSWHVTSPHPLCSKTMASSSLLLSWEEFAKWYIEITTVWVNLIRWKLLEGSQLSSAANLSLPLCSSSFHLQLLYHLLSQHKEWVSLPCRTIFHRQWLASLFSHPYLQSFYRHPSILFLYSWFFFTAFQICEWPFKDLLIITFSALSSLLSPALEFLAPHPSFPPCLLQISRSNLFPQIGSILLFISCQATVHYIP